MEARWTDRKQTPSPASVHALNSPNPAQNRYYSNFNPEDLSKIHELESIAPGHQHFTILERERLVLLYPNEPKLRAKLASILFLLKDYHGAYEQGEKVERLLAASPLLPETDQRFEEWLEHVRQECMRREQEAGKHFSRDDVDEWTSIQTRWR